MDKHFINRTTLLPKSIVERNQWLDSGYKDNLVISHYLCDMFDFKTALVLNCRYGTLSEVLLEKKKKIVSIDKNEKRYNSLSDNVKNTFRTADITSPVLNLGLFDLVISIKFKDIVEDIKFDNFVDFATRHSNNFICLVVNDFRRLRNKWIDSFISKNYIYREDLVQSVFSLLDKVGDSKILGTLIFENKYPKTENYEDAGTSEET